MAISYENKYLIPLTGVMERGRTRKSSRECRRS